MNIDRTDIAPLLVPYFPTMEQASSDDWQAFLNAQTGLDVAVDEPNASAFDKWRQALATQGYPVWDVTEAQAAAMKKRGEDLKAAEDKRRADEATRLAELAKEAPNVTAQDLLDKAAQP